MEQFLLHFFRQVLERDFEVDAIMFGQTAEEHLVVDEQPSPAATPRRNCAVRDGFVAIGNDQIRIEKQLCAEAVTGPARAVWGIKREMAGRELAIADAAFGARVLVAE